MNALPNPTALTNATRFRPSHVRAHSRSPSRSPVRRAQFTAQHLDPLLRNLSPDSTLKALQATGTIPAGPEEDVLTSSIADTSPAEREIGIRAAFAAQKLRQWRNEVSKWQWPGRRDRGLGVGFLPPEEIASQQQDVDKPRIYLGCLPSEVVDQYELRIDEIRDALETLEMEDIKDHVLQAHTSKTQTTTSAESSETQKMPRKSYGRMRDFTALITATVIQALPDLAYVSMLIDTWNIRLTILRELPLLLDVMKAARAGIRAATTAVRDPKQAPLITMEDFETTKQMLGEKVADFGVRIDKMLDLLDGQEDSLPQFWIDTLETIELDYATWVVETQRVATQNQSKSQAEEPKVPEAVEPSLQEAIVNAVKQPDPAPDLVHAAHASVQEALNIGGSNGRPEQHAPPVEESKPFLRVEPPPSRGHRREISEVSAAESAYSAYSDVSKAEIINATQTQVLPSPKVNVVESPAREKPPMLQRASTTSIEVVPKDQLRTVDLRRSMSADLLSKMSQTPDSTPSKALEQLTGHPKTGTTPLAELEDPTSALSLEGDHSFPEQSATYVESDQTVSSLDDEISPITPSLPRRSSKRKSAGHGMFAASERSSSPSELVSPIDAPAANEMRFLSPKSDAANDRGFDAEDGSLEAKIQDILLKLPTKIRLTKNGAPQYNEDASASSTRASTPTPGITLSPAKPSRRSSTNDTDVRVFHLTQHGQSRDSAPIKLFVRTVGENGERVMVRVGGGWADLGEYLKEYSLHHGHRNVSEGQLEVAQYPLKQRKESQGRSITSQHTRARSRSPSPPGKPDAEEKIWAPPPVPPIPNSYTVQTPTLTSVSRPNGEVVTTIDDPQALSEDYFNARSPPVAVRTKTAKVPGVTTTTTVSVPQNSKSASYTPLGAAGPKASARRAATYGTDPNAKDDAWVEGMVGKARAVSNTVQGPTTTTTTTVTSSAPASRRTSAMVVPSTSQSKPKQIPSAAAVPPTSQPKPKQIVSTKESEAPGRRKSLLGLGDGSIRRVFLRRKSEK
jgi:hypothetical protein